MAYNQPLVSIVILDFNRSKEASLLIRSLKHAEFEHEIVYVSNGGEQDYVLDYYWTGKIDRMVLNTRNEGCGLGTRLGFHAALGKYVLYCQVDQWLCRAFYDHELQQIIRYLETNLDFLYADLAGNQGHGVFSERALLIDRLRYLAIPGLEETVGGPGPYADQLWTEQLVQEYMKREYLKILHVTPLLFGDNGKWSRRTFPCGAETLHSTDEKRLFIIKPFRQRYDNFPNLKLNEEEWKMALNGTWPKEGLIPEADKPHSFIHWRE